MRSTRYPQAARRPFRAGWPLLLACAAGSLTPLPAVAIDNGRYVIQSVHSQLCLDVAAASTADGANVQQYTCNGTGAQSFDVTAVGDGYYRITNTHSGKVLDVQSRSFADGGNVQQWTNFNSANQQFRITDLGGGRYEIRARHSNKCVDVAEFSNVPGGNIQQWACNPGQPNQTWRFNGNTPPPYDGFENPPDQPGLIEIGVKNGCGFPIWIHAAGHEAVLQPDNAELAPGKVRWYFAPQRWTAARVTAYGGGPRGEELEKAEMTFVPESGGTVLNYNVTYVDWLGLPIDVNGIGGGADCRAATCAVPRQNVLNGCPDGLRQGNKCIAPRTHCLNPANQGQELCRRLDAEVARCANTKPGCEGARNARTPEAYACSGAFANNPKYCAALNRGMLDDPDSTDRSRYYQRWPYSTYSKWVHQTCPGLYAFPYDDYPSSVGESGFHSCTQGKRLQITFCPKG